MWQHGSKPCPESSSPLMPPECTSPSIENRSIEDLVHLLNESKEDRCAGYDHFLTYGSFDVFRKQVPGTPLYTYLAHGTMAVDTEHFYESYLDLDYRSDWDEYAMELRTLDDSKSSDCQDSLGEEYGDKVAIYWSVKFPWPLSNRDYVFERTNGVIACPTSSTPVYVIKSHGCSHPDVPEKKGFVRVDTYASQMVMREMSNGSDNVNGKTKTMELLLLYFDDLKGSIPSFIVNWACEKALPNFIDVCEKSCVEYGKWKEKKK